MEFGSTFLLAAFAGGSSIATIGVQPAFVPAGFVVLVLITGGGV